MLESVVLSSVDKGRSYLFSKDRNKLSPTIFPPARRYASAQSLLKTDARSGGEDEKRQKFNPATLFKYFDVNLLCEAN